MDARWMLVILFKVSNLLNIYYNNIMNLTQSPFVWFPQWVNEFVCAGYDEVYVCHWLCVQVKMKSMFAIGVVCRSRWSLCSPLALRAGQDEVYVCHWLCVQVTMKSMSAVGFVCRSRWSLCSPLALRSLLCSACSTLCKLILLVCSFFCVAQNLSAVAYYFFGMHRFIIL